MPPMSDLVRVGLPLAATLCVFASCIAFASILEAREARNEQRRRCRRTLCRGELHPNPRAGTPRQRLWASQEDCGRRGDDDSGEEDDSTSTTEASTSDDGFSLHDDDDDDEEPPPGEKRAAPVTTKKATQPFEMSDPAPPVKSDNEDSGDDLIRAAPAKGKGKGVQADKRKSLDNEDEDSDAYIRRVKKTKATTQAGAKLASKTTTVRKPSGSTKLPPKKAHAKATETSDVEI
ncbi:hypothetical protein EDB89DRAFT_2243310 [Lactarius sanguifluus]|nr:hypothetical protein EDB89DRAFT_2243310 [Lactarius sanguifluus]